jgi:hypothetical protein
VRVSEEGKIHRNSDWPSFQVPLFVDSAQNGLKIVPSDIQLIKKRIRVVSQIPLLSGKPH